MKQQRKSPPQSQQQRGHIVADYRICCGLCGKYEALATRTRADAHAEAHKRGYVETKSRGFLCPACFVPTDPNLTD